MEVGEPWVDGEGVIRDGDAVGGCTDAGDEDNVLVGVGDED